MTQPTIKDGAIADDITAGTATNIAGDLSFVDNDHLYLGTGNDLDIYHNGGNSVAKNITGALFIESAASTIAAFTQTAAKLYFSSAQKLETVTGGVNITGALDVSGGVDKLQSATTIIDVAAATAPVAGQVLTASSGTAADWQTPAAGQTLTEDLSIAVPTNTNIILAALPTWANKITILIDDLRWTVGNFVPYLYMGPGSTQGNGINLKDGTTVTSLYSPGNGNKLTMGVATANITGWWGGTIILRKIPGTFHWTIDVNLHETTESGTGSSPFQYTSASGVHLGTGNLTQVDFGRGTEIQHATVKVTYDE